MKNQSSYTLSILIPAYNVEKWIGRCLESICNQNEEHAEVVIIDDGSTDDTLLIANRYAKRFPDIRVLQQANQGVSTTRNRLLEEAQGKYIWFVDADDYIQEDCLGMILDYISHNPNIDLLTLCYRQDGHCLHERQDLFSGSGSDYLLRYTNDGYLWTKIIKREILIGQQIRFNTNLHSQEDWLFLMEIYPWVNILHETNIKGYIYCSDNAESIMRKKTAENDRRNVESSIEALITFKHFMERYKEQEIYVAYSRWLNFSAAGLLFCLLPLKWKIRDVNAVIARLREVGIYPIPSTIKWKYNLFLMIANRQCLYNILLWVRNIID